MSDASDMDLVRDYAEHQSEAAFAELVRRHVNLAYSVALRITGSSSEAEDVAQAVFIILAKKAAGLRAGTAVTGWVYETTRFTALQSLRTQARRHRREQEAHMQSTLDGPTDETIWRQMGPLLEEAMSRLNEKERTLLALHYFENRTSAESAAILGIGEWAIRKRAARALEKLRRYLSTRGVDSTTAAIAGAISVNSIQVAPAALVTSITAAALAKGATASGSSLILTKATLIAMKTKTLVVSVAAVVIAAGIGGYLLHRSQAARTPAVYGDHVPIKFANDSFKDLESRTHDANESKFLSELDSNTRRLPDSAPSWHIKCLVEPTSSGSADFLRSLTNFVARGMTDASFAHYRVETNSTLLGKRIRIRGWMKSNDVRNWAGTEVSIFGENGRVFVNDSMYDRPIHGTTDWQQIEIVTDVPAEPCSILLLPSLYGTGEIWLDDFQIDLAPPGMAITDDRNWQVWSQDPIDYSESIDYTVRHNGHPTMLIAYVSPEAPVTNAFVWWGKKDRESEKSQQYPGHTVRMSVWAKSEDISPRAGLDFQPKDGSGKQLAHQRGGEQIRGTTDWKEYSVTCVIPKNTEIIQTAVFMYGSGKYWVDTNSWKLEIVK